MHSPWSEIQSFKFSKRRGKIEKKSIIIVNLWRIQRIIKIITIEYECECLGKFTGRIIIRQYIQYIRPNVK